nr:polysaccharide biosynthesis protein [Nocardioidaceae bacterium]
QLCLEAMNRMLGGEVFILKMPRVRVGDLVETLIEAYAPQFGYRADQIAIETIGIRSGEKVHEALMTADEGSRAETVGAMYVVQPQSAALLGRASAVDPDADGPVLDRNELRDLLDRAGWLRPQILPSMG